MQKNNNYHEILSNSEKLLKIYRRLLLTYKDNAYLEQYQTTNINANIKCFQKIVNEFFQYLGNDVHNLYKRMLSKNHIKITNSKNISGYCINNPNSELSTIKCFAPKNSFANISIVIHEMGHIYQFYLAKERYKNNVFYLNEEIMAFLFEKLFIQFLTDNCHRREANKYQINYQEAILYQTIKAKILTSLYLKGKLYVSKNECQVSCPIDDVISQVEKESNNTFFFDNKVDLYSNIYTTNDILANYFFNIMQKDFKEGFSDVKHFINQTRDEKFSKIINICDRNLPLTLKKIETISNKQLVKRNLSCSKK